MINLYPNEKSGPAGFTVKGSGSQQKAAAAAAVCCCCCRWALFVSPQNCASDSILAAGALRRALIWHFGWPRSAGAVHPSVRLPAAAHCSCTHFSKSTFRTHTVAWVAACGHAVECVLIERFWNIYHLSNRQVHLVAANIWELRVQPQWN